VTLRERAEQDSIFFQAAASGATSGRVETAAGSAPPWVVPPPGFEGFDFSGVIATPANNGLDTVVLEFFVPSGYEGVINKLSHRYTGGGFQSGQGDLAWRIFRNDQAVKNYDNILVQFGTENELREIAGIRIYSGEKISYVVNHAVASALAIGGTFIIAFASGWFYPAAGGTQ
jgi:hypothetical protein